MNPKAKHFVKSEGAIFFFDLVAIGGHCLANFYWTYPRISLYSYTWVRPCAICNNMHFWRFSTSVILLPQKRWTGVESNNLFTLLPTSLDSGLDLSSPVSSDQDHVSLSIIWNIYTSQTGKISRLQNNAKCAQIGRFNGAVFSCTSCTTLNCRLWKSNSCMQEELTVFQNCFRHCSGITHDLKLNSLKLCRNGFQVVRCIQDWHPKKVHTTCQSKELTQTSCFLVSTY